MDETPFRSYVASHPRMIGAVFATLLYLTQTGSALGAGITIHCGP